MPNGWGSQKSMSRRLSSFFWQFSDLLFEFALAIVLDYSVLWKLNGHCWPMLHDPPMQKNHTNKQTK